MVSKLGMATEGMTTGWLVRARSYGVDVAMCGYAGS